MPLVSAPANIVFGGTIEASDVLNLYSAINGNLDSQNLAEGGILGLNIADATVGQTKLSTSFLQFGVATVQGHYTTGTGSFTASAYNLSVPIGAFGFMPLVQTPDNVTAAMLGGHAADSSTFTPTADPLIIVGPPAPDLTFELFMLFGVWSSDNTTSHAVSWQFNYLTSSPPWNLGEGDMALFAFMMIDEATGAVDAVSVCEDPPWKINHPSKKLFLQNQVLEAMGNPDKIEQLHADLDRPQWMSHADLNASQVYKNSLMPRRPHPFMRCDLTGKKIVMLDPLSKMAERLATLAKSGESVPLLLHQGHVVLGDEVTRVGPPGVTIQKCAFRSTR